MIVVQVEHFLNKPGQAYFPTWLSEVAAVLSGFAGFVSIRQLRRVDDPAACHLLLEFRSLPELRAWSKSQAHDDLIGRLEPYRLKKQVSQVFEAGERLST